MSDLTVPAAIAGLLQWGLDGHDWVAGDLWHTRKPAVFNQYDLRHGCILFIDAYNIV